MKNGTRWMIWTAMTLAACDDSKVATDENDKTSAQLEIIATPPEAQLPVVAWETGDVYSGFADFALQDLTATSGQASRWTLRGPSPEEATESASELLKGTFSLGFLGLAPAGHAALVEASFKDDESGVPAPLTLVAQNYAVIFVSEPQPAQSFVAGYYNAYEPITAGVHLVHFRDPTTQEARKAQVCQALASRLALAEYNQKYQTSYADEDALYEDTPADEAGYDQYQERLSTYELAVETHNIELSCPVGSAIGKLVPAGEPIDLQAASEEPVVDWD